MKILNAKSFVSLFLLAALSFPAFGAKGVIVSVDVPGMSFQAKTSKVKGKVIKSGDTYKAEDISVKVKSLKTEMDLRDDHLRDKLEYKKHSKITVTKGIAKGGKGKAIIEIKGIKKSVNFAYKESGGLFIAKFSLSLKDFGITGISYMGLGVKDKVVVEASVPIK